MAIFSENQSRQLYVVNSVVTGSTEVTNNSAAGATKVKESADKKEFFFAYKGASADGLQRTDVVNKCNIMDIRATAAEDMKHIMMKKKVALKSTINSGNPILGEDYVLNVEIKNYIAIGTDSTKGKFAAARAFNNVPSDLYKALAINLAKNMSREAVPMIKITLDGDSSNTEITNRTKVADLASITATGIIIEEVEQPWRLGIAKQEFVSFDIFPSTIYADNMDQIWGVVTDVTAANTNKLPNSKIVADMEYAFHKNRGDIYGNQGWPVNIDTAYMVNPSDANGYSMLDIHFFYESNSHNVGHSEKTITLVGDKTVLDSFVNELESTILSGYNVTIKKSANW
jgi:hypothetical protein